MSIPPYHYFLPSVESSFIHTKFSLTDTVNYV